MIWKRELITPVPKELPPPPMNKLRPISGIFVFAKVADRILAKMATSDMETERDVKQYGNEKGLSTNHYLINMIHKILLSLDQNTNSKKMACILKMVDWFQAFERQSHYLGVKSFINNGRVPQKWFFGYLIAIHI